MKYNYVRLFPILLCLSLLIFSGCSSDESSWQKTENKEKLWTTDAGFMGKYVWNGDTVFGYINGTGKLITKNYSDDVVDTRVVNAQYGMVNESTVVKVGKYCYWGEMDDNEISGEGVIRMNDTIFVLGNFDKGSSSSVKMVNSKGSIIYKGGWKNFARHGSGILYYPNGKIQYEGLFKYGDFHGYGTLYDENGKSVSHMWVLGKPDPSFSYLYDILNNNKDRITESRYNSLINQLAFYEHYQYWLIGFVVLLHICFLIFLQYFYSFYGQEYYWYTFPDKIKTAPFFLWWFFGGFLGAHRFRLGSKSGFLYIISFTILLFTNIKELIAFAGAYNIHAFCQTITQKNISLVCIGFNVIFWLFDIIWIGYRVYFLNSKYYRYDCRETSILKNEPTDVDDLMLDVSNHISDIMKEISKKSNSALSISKEKKQHSTSFGKLIDYGEKSFLEDKNQRVSNCIESMKQQTQVLYDFANLQLSYLKEYRVNAYRNLNLAKEMFGFFREISSKEQTIHTDNIELGKEVNISYVDTSKVEIKVDFDELQRNINTTMTILEGFGVDESVGKNIGGAVAVGIQIINVLYQRNQAMKMIAQNIKTNVEQLDTITDEALKVETTVLRANEVLKSLYKANAAFLFAYTKIRDRVFPKISFFDYLRGINRKNEYLNSQEFQQDIALLMKVCSEYNKINNVTL